jgi:glycine cleavage system regulatory protein
VLAEFNVNVDKLNTEVTEASMSGEILFNAAVRLRIPESCDLTGLQESLERMANELMVVLIFRNDISSIPLLN